MKDRLEKKTEPMHDRSDKPQMFDFKKTATGRSPDKP
jgi:hypothetical protein